MIEAIFRVEATTDGKSGTYRLFTYSDSVDEDGIKVPELLTISKCISQIRKLYTNIPNRIIDIHSITLESSRKLEYVSIGGVIEVYDDP